MADAERQNKSPICFRAWNKRIDTSNFTRFYVLIVLDIIMITMGVVYINECPVSRYIPIFLILSGAVNLGPTFLSVMKRKFTKSMASKIISTSLEVSLHLCSFGVFIAGSVFTYQVFPPSFSRSHRKYCHIVCYVYAFIYESCVLVTVVYILLTTLLFVCLEKSIFRDVRLSQVRRI